MSKNNIVELQNGGPMIEKLDETEKDYQWFIKNKKELRKKFVNKFIAISDKKVIASSEDVNMLIKELKEKKVEDAIIEFIEPENVVIIYLWRQ